MDGEAYIQGLTRGVEYTVTETVPANYAAEGDTTKKVTVSAVADCGTERASANTVSFVNVPLSNITVSFDDQVPGGTRAKISCASLTATPPDGTPNVFNDESETFVGLKPGTYTFYMRGDTKRKYIRNPEAIPAVEAEQ